jgi:hypothetical protein
MKHQFLVYLGICGLFLIHACSKSAVDRNPDLVDNSASFSTDGKTSSSSGTGDSLQTPAGVLTAGEWNDLNHWNFWDSLQQVPDFSKMTAYWNFYPSHRMSVQVVDLQGNAAIDVAVDLKMNGVVVAQARTDNYGNAELWPGLLDANFQIGQSVFQIVVADGQFTQNDPIFYKDGVNKIQLPFQFYAPQGIQVALVVDATGSMGDEISYLKAELEDVLKRVEQDHPGSDLLTGALFYRDEGDDYLTRLSQFTNNIATSTNFVKNQEAGGGGDFPEAVHTALQQSISDLQWSPKARTRLIFLVLDAPPHHTPQVIQSLQQSILQAQEKGVKIIPITASGIDKETEFLMRYFAMTTNGSYVFITNHSGIGNPHLEATVGPYRVEFLNDLMVRLINFYAE